MSITANVWAMREPSNNPRVRATGTLEDAAVAGRDFDGSGRLGCSYIVGWLNDKAISPIRRPVTR